MLRLTDSFELNFFVSFIFADAKHLCEDKPISTVSAGKKWLSVGSQDGFVYILNLNGLEVRYNIRLCDEMI